MEPTARPRYGALLMALIGLVGLLLILQYLAGLWTDVNAMGPFTTNSSSPALDLHYDLGYALGILSLVALIVSTMAKRWRLVPFTAVTFISVLVAGVAGGDFVRTNDGFASFVMGTFFLVAFGSNFMASMVLRRQRATLPPLAPAAHAL